MSGKRCLRNFFAAIFLSSPKLAISSIVGKCCSSRFCKTVENGAEIGAQTSVRTRYRGSERAVRAAQTCGAELQLISRGQTLTWVAIMGLGDFFRPRIELWKPWSRRRSGSVPQARGGGGNPLGQGVITYSSSGSSLVRH